MSATSSTSTAASRSFSRPFRVSHDDLLWWSLKTCWSSVCSGRSQKTGLQGPLIEALYPERTIAFMRKAAAKYSEKFRYNRGGLIERRRAFTQQRHLKNKCKCKISTFI